MIQRMSDEHKIGFIDSTKPEEKKAENVSVDKEDSISSQRAKRLENKDDGLKTNQHISSARTGNISDFGGPATYIKSETSNTIWENNKTGDTHTKIQEESRAKEQRLSEVAKVKEEDKVNSKVENPSDNTSFSRLSDFKGSSYHISQTGMSIFDTKDFQRLSAKTEGETLSDDISQRRSVKDESWRNNGKSVGTKEAMNKLFDSLFKQEK